MPSSTTFRRAVPLTAVSLTAVALALAACQDTPGGVEPTGASAARAAIAPSVHRQYGVPVPLGQGRVRSYVQLDEQGGRPLEIGVAFDSLALFGLPAPMDHPMEGHGDMHEYRLQLPPRAPAPYQFVELDWNPQGHEPDGVYTVPHFDFHFYTISLAERNAIDPADPRYAAQAANFPAPEYIRPNFMCPCTIFGTPAAAVAVPRMGVHWLDVTSPELHGAPFTSTMINGTWDGRVIFQEPMITRAFILGTTDATLPIAMPKRGSPAGWYPGAYRITYDARAREYRVALTNLKWLQ